MDSPISTETIGFLFCYVFLGGEGGCCVRACNGLSTSMFLCACIYFATVFPEDDDCL